MRWWSRSSDGRRRAVESVSSGVLWQERRENGAQWCLVTSPADTPVALTTNGIKVFIGVSQLGHRTGQKALCFPSVMHCFRSEVDRSPGGQQECTLQGMRYWGSCGHSEASWPASASGSSLTLTGLRAERRGLVELELEPRGLMGLWLEQQGRPSREEEVSAPASWSRQYERGQKSQRDEAGAPQTLQSCHGHSQRPADRHGGHYGFKPGGPDPH